MNSPPSLILDSQRRANARCAGGHREVGSSEGSSSSCSFAIADLAPPRGGRRGKNSFPPLSFNCRKAAPTSNFFADCARVLVR